MPQKIIAKFKAEPKKTAFMCVLLVCFVAVAIRTMRGPSSAAAMIQPIAPIEVQIVPVNLEMPTLDESQTEKIVDLPKRDIFALDPNIFPRTSEEAESGTDLDAKQMRFNALKTKIQTFKIQSTMTGDTPTAFIDQTLVRENDVYKGFKVKRIDDASVTLEADGFTFVLSLKG